MLSAIVFLRGNSEDNIGDNPTNYAISEIGKKNVDHLLSRLHEMVGGLQFFVAMQYWYIPGWVLSANLCERFGWGDIFLGAFVGARGVDDKTALEHKIHVCRKSKEKCALIVAGYFDGYNYPGRETAAGSYLHSIVRDLPLAGFPEVRLREAVTDNTLAFVVNFDSKEFHVLERVLEPEEMETPSSVVE